MSDLETPEADMMRDHSSLDAAPATLRPKSCSRVSIPTTPARPLTPRGATSILLVWVGRYQTPCGMMLSGYLPIAAG